MNIKAIPVNRIIIFFTKVISFLLCINLIIFIKSIDVPKILDILDLISNIYNIDDNYKASDLKISYDKAIKDIDNIIYHKKNLDPAELYLLNKKKEQLQHMMTYIGLKNRPKDPKDPLIAKERDIILKTYYPGNQIKDINIINDMKFPFGNQIAAFNKLIFYCEIIHCSKIYLPEDNNMYIKHTLYDNGLTIQVGNEDSFVNATGITYLSYNFFYDFYTLKIENRVEVFKKEILNNLPLVNISKNDLIIHFRSSDIFQHVNDFDYAPDYAQPPLCFYESILKNFKFSKIYIISVDDIYNPVIKKLREKYPDIIYNENPLEVDISYLARGYNIVGSISSFLISSIKLNDNLKYLWEYDIYPMSGRLFHSHHSINNEKRKYTIYLMKPSEQYKNKMVVWKSSEEQINIMLNDKCPQNFITIKPNIS